MPLSGEGAEADGCGAAARLREESGPVAGGVGGLETSIGSGGWSDTSVGSGLGGAEDGDKLEDDTNRETCRGEALTSTLRARNMPAAKFAEIRGVRIRFEASPD